MGQQDPAGTNPPAEISPARGAFLTHSNYIRAFDWLIRVHYGTPRGPFELLPDPDRTHEAVSVAVRASALYGRLSHRAEAERGAVVSILRNAWSAEILLASTGELASDEIIALANIKRPWITCDDDTCWDLVAMALRTTREDPLKDQLRSARERKRAEAKKMWRREEHARLEQGKRRRKEPSLGLPVLSADEKRVIDRRLRPFTLLDYLFRLRIRSNYHDTTMFEDGPERVTDSRSVHDCLRGIASSTLLVHELLVERLIGRASMREALDRWIGASTVTAGRIGVNARRHLILQ